MCLKPSTTLINGVEPDLQTVEMLLGGVKNNTRVTAVAAEKQTLKKD